MKVLRLQRASDPWSRDWRFLLGALTAIVLALIVGAALAITPLYATGAVVFLVLLFMSRSREVAVTLWLGLRVLMFSGYIPLLLGEAMLLIVTAAAVGRQVFSGRRIQMPKSPWLWLFVLLLAFVNLAYFGFISESRDYIIEILVENFLLVTLIANTQSKWSREGVVTAAGAVLIGIALVALVEWIKGAPLINSPGRIAYEPLAVLHTYEGALRLGSILLNPDLLAAAMILGFIVWTGIALESRGLVRWVAMSFAFAILWVAFLTLSRTVFLAVPIGLAVLFAFALVKRQVSASQVTVSVTGVFAAIIASLVLVPSSWTRVTTDLADPLRLGAYQTAIRIILAYPFEGLGAGWNRYLLLEEPYRVADQYRPLAHPHNSFLELAAMLGLPVALLISLMIGKSLVVAATTRLKMGVSAIPVAGVTVMIVMAFTGDPITIPVLGNLFWALWAVTTPDTSNPRSSFGVIAVPIAKLGTVAQDRRRSGARA